MVRLRVLIIPSSVNLDTHATLNASSEVRKFLHITSPKNSLVTVENECINQFFKLYPSEKSLDVVGIQNGVGLDLDPEYLVEEVFTLDSDNTLRVLVSNDLNETSDIEELTQENLKKRNSSVDDDDTRRKLQKTIWNSTFHSHIFESDANTNDSRSVLTISSDSESDVNDKSQRNSANAQAFPTDEVIERLPEPKEIEECQKEKSKVSDKVNEEFEKTEEEDKEKEPEPEPEPEHAVGDQSLIDSTVKLNGDGNLNKQTSEKILKVPVEKLVKKDDKTVDDNGKSSITKENNLDNKSEDNLAIVEENKENEIQEKPSKRIVNTQKNSNKKVERPITNKTEKSKVGKKNETKKVEPNAESSLPPEMVEFLKSFKIFNFDQELYKKFQNSIEKDPNTGETLIHKGNCETCLKLHRRCSHHLPGCVRCFMTGKNCVYKSNGRSSNRSSTATKTTSSGSVTPKSINDNEQKQESKTETETELESEKHKIIGSISASNILNTKKRTLSTTSKDSNENLEKKSSKNEEKSNITSTFTSQNSLNEKKSKRSSNYEEIQFKDLPLFKIRTTVTEKEFEKFIQSTKKDESTEKPIINRTACVHCRSLRRRCSRHFPTCIGCYFREKDCDYMEIKTNEEKPKNTKSKDEKDHVDEKDKEIELKSTKEGDSSFVKTKRKLFKKQKGIKGISPIAKKDKSKRSSFTLTPRNTQPETDGDDDDEYFSC